MALLNNRPLNELAPECQSFLDCIHAFNPNELLLGYQKCWIADDSQLKIAEKTRSLRFDMGRSRRQRFNC